MSDLLRNVTEAQSGRLTLQVAPGITRAVRRSGPAGCSNHAGDAASAA